MDAADHDDEREGDADNQNRSLDKVGVEHRLESAGVGINDGDDPHDDDQQVDIDPRNFRECNGRQIHDDGHASELKDDEHERAEDTEFAALKTLLEVVIRRIDLQAAVDRQEVADRQRDGEQHTELRPPENPRAVIRVARDGKEGNRAEQRREDGDAGNVPGDGAVALEELLALHFLF